MEREAMEFDVLIVGGGPAGASCAWALRQAGLDVVVLDQAQFPRDKVCAGWITPPVLTALGIDPQDYGMAKNMAGQCPDCGNLLVYQEGCFKCMVCGYTKC